MQNCDDCGTRYDPWNTEDKMHDKSECILALILQRDAALLQNEAMRAALEHIVGTPSQEPVIMGIASIARHGLRYTLKQEDGNAKEES